ncbi:MAG: DUF4212 domain-containing protein [Azonexus sp.]|nr:sodium/substrate symporter small subunit [Azonexus sp.]MCK6413311.1 DUF4212 domain-containing protein [Azonexus sp.]
MPENDAYWRQTRLLTLLLLGLWILITFVLAWFAQEINRIVVFGFPLGFYMDAQGVLALYLAIIWYYNRRMAQLDRHHGIDDE